MNPGQEKFLEFMMDRAQGGKEADLKEALLDSFSKQKEAPLTKEGFLSLKKQMQSLIKPEAMEEVSQAMDHFGKNL